MNYQENFYEPLVSVLREDTGSVDEDFVQRLWFEELFKNSLMTQSGEQITVCQPGFWNKERGPDFQRVALRNEKGELEVGDAEIHLRAEDWMNHGHDQDAAYENVILHVVWKFGDKAYFAGTRSHRALRQVELSSQLRVPIEKAQLFLNTTLEERLLGTRLGQCGRDLEAFSEQEVIELLRQAGQYRFNKKQKLWHIRADTWGYGQALWLGLADALGYSRNRISFHALARMLPIEQLIKMKDDVKREALLFGVAGFMPGQKLPEGAHEKEWLRKLWDEWWLMRSDWDERILPLSKWKRSGIRPVNRPERRLAVLAKISEPGVWRQFVSVCQSTDADQVWKFFEKMKHTFWSSHYSVHGKAMSKPLALLGESRIQAFLFNVVWTLGWQYSDKHPIIQHQLEALRSTSSNQSARRAALRLLGKRKNQGNVKRELSRLLIQEGLLQVYRDFCLADASNCQRCEFPSWVEKFRKRNKHG